MVYSGHDDGPLCAQLGQRVLTDPTLNTKWLAELLRTRAKHLACA